MEGESSLDKKPGLLMFTELRVNYYLLPNDWLEWFQPDKKYFDLVWIWTRDLTNVERTLYQLLMNETNNICYYK